MKDSKGSGLLLTIGEAADLLRISERTMYRMIRAGKIKPIYLTPDTPRIARGTLEQMVGEMLGEDEKHGGRD